MRIGHIELFVQDPPGEAREFYERVLGFEVTVVQGGNVWLKLGEVEVLLRPAQSAAGGAAPAPANSYGRAAGGVVLYTDDLPAEMERLRSRGLEFDGTDGSDKCATFRDPDGHWFQLVNPHDH